MCWLQVDLCHYVCAVETLHWSAHTAVTVQCELVVGLRDVLPNLPLNDIAAQRLGLPTRPRRDQMASEHGTQTKTLVSARGGVLSLNRRPTQQPTPWPTLESTPARVATNGGDVGGTLFAVYIITNITFILYFRWFLRRKHRLRRKERHRQGIYSDDEFGAEYWDDDDDAYWDATEDGATGWDARDAPAGDHALTTFANNEYSSKEQGDSELSFDRPPERHSSEAMPPDAVFVKSEEVEWRNEEGEWEPAKIVEVTFNKALRPFYSIILLEDQIEMGAAPSRLRRRGNGGIVGRSRRAQEARRGEGGGPERVTMSVDRGLMQVGPGRGFAQQMTQDEFGEGGGDGLGDQARSLPRHAHSRTPDKPGHPVATGRPGGLEDDAAPEDEGRVRVRSVEDVEEGVYRDDSESSLASDPVERERQLRQRRIDTICDDCFGDMEWWTCSAWVGLLCMLLRCFAGVAFWSFALLGSTRLSVMLCFVAWSPLSQVGWALRLFFEALVLPFVMCYLFHLWAQRQAEHRKERLGLPIKLDELGSDEESYDSYDSDGEGGHCNDNYGDGVSVDVREVRSARVLPNHPQSLPVLLLIFNVLCLVRLCGTLA